VKRITIFAIFFLIMTSSVFAIQQIRGEIDDWTKQNLLQLDKVESGDKSIPYSSDLLTFFYDHYLDKIFIRIGFVSLRTITKIPRENLWIKDNISLQIHLTGGDDRLILTIDNSGEIVGFCSNGEKITGRALVTHRYDMVELEIDNPFPENVLQGLKFHIRSFSGGTICDEMTADTREPFDGNANCALMHHGNQALCYTEVFRGRSADLDGSGFDEVLEAHDVHDIPVNIHLSGTLIGGAAWNDTEFIDWVYAGAAAGWIDLHTSAYAQHIMPFVEDNMNDWAVNIHRNMTHTYFNYWAEVAWVPERVFLDGPGGDYPNAGVIDYIADDFTDHDIDAIILDDNVHLSGYNNHQIHTLAGSSLRLIPRDDYFTGRLHAGDWSSALAVLSDLAAPGGEDGDYRIVVYADDWEMAAEMGEWATSMPDAKETYDFFIDQCYINNSWLHVWKLASAVANPNFNGTTLTPDYGTHPSIGGTDGYGGGDNGWYTDWAGYSSPSDYHSTPWNFGYIWADARNNLMTAPSNNIAETGWYVLMSNLYETGWHDGMGGPISGWEMKFSTHIKNTNVYAEGARWVDGTPSGIGAFFNDWDHDGSDELIIHNDKVCAVFEGIGGRAAWIFAKSGANNASIVGNCNAYWEGTEDNYNDANHIAAFSDVGVGGHDYEHALYDWEIAYSSTDSAEIILRHDNVRKRIKLKTGESFLRCEYFTRDKQTYIKTGFSPDMVSMLWGPDIQRIWGSGAYPGFRNRNNDAIGAYILGAGGATHSAEFQSTYLNGDEIQGTGTFGFYLYAGYQSADVSGNVLAFNLLQAGLTDKFPPDAYKASYNKGTDMFLITFTETLDVSETDLNAIGFDENADGAVDVWLDGTCTVTNTDDSPVLKLELSSAKVAAVEVLSPTNMILALNPGAVEDIAGNDCRELRNGFDEVEITVMGELAITIDGYIEPGEWPWYSLFIDDPDDDSEWSVQNEIYVLYFFWDDTYVYFAINGLHEVSPFNNSWLLFIDSDFGSANGERDLTEIDAWDRNAEFTVASGFKADFQYGSYTGWAGDFWKILTDTTTSQITDDFWSETDLTSANPASELAVSWDQLYELGEGRVLSGATIALVASIAGGTDLGGDIVPNNISAALPLIDNFDSVTIDGDNDGYPDDASVVLNIDDSKPLRAGKFALAVSPNPFNSSVRFQVSGNGCQVSRIEIFDLKGNVVWVVGDERLAVSDDNRQPPTSNREFIWTPDESITSGIYLVKARTKDRQTTSTRVVYLR